METKRIISMHPKLAAVLDALVGLILLAFVGRFATLWFVAGWWAVRVLWWVILAQMVYCPASISRVYHALSLAVGNFGCAVFFLLVDWQNAWWVVAVLFLALPFATFWFIPEKGFELSFNAKPLRRLKLLFGIMGMAGVTTGLVALSVLQIIDRSTVWMWGIVAVIVVGFFSGYSWQQYDLKVTRRLVVAASLLALTIGEMIYAVLLWPIGYLASGFLLTWCWYIGWLQLRYALTQQGVQWKRQAPFLILNGVLLVIYLLFIVRWK